MRTEWARHGYTCSRSEDFHKTCPVGDMQQLIRLDHELPLPVCHIQDSQHEASNHAAVAEEKCSGTNLLKCVDPLAGKDCLPGSSSSDNARPIRVQKFIENGHLTLNHVDLSSRLAFNLVQSLSSGCGHHYVELPGWAEDRHNVVYVLLLLESH